MSREETGVVIQLFKEHVPEIAAGDVVIVALARIEGVRTKVAVQAKVPAIDAVRACCGKSGSRIRELAKRLGRERLDLLRWDDCVETLIGRALQPALVQEVILHPAQHRATVVVGKSQVQHARGKNGENLQLTSQLTGWQINIAVAKE